MINIVENRNWREKKDVNLCVFDGNVAKASACCF